MQPQYRDIYSLPFGQGKERRVVVVSRDTLNGGDYVVVVPFTTQKLDERKKLPSCVFVPGGIAGPHGVTKDCIAKADEISRILKNEIDWTQGKKGRLPTEYMEQIIKAIRYVIRDPDLSAEAQPRVAQAAAASSSQE